jgi:hypothetical protein
MVPGQGFAGTGGSGRVESGDGWCGAVGPVGWYSTEPFRSDEAWCVRAPRERPSAGGGPRRDLARGPDEDRLTVPMPVRWAAAILPWLVSRPGAVATNEHPRWP